MKVHLIGAGGIGMSALAQLYLRRGHTVTGSDREESPTTELLEKKGMRVSVPQDAKNISADVELVVYSDAVWEDNPERVRAKELSIPQVSYFQALGEETQGKTILAITGTHGKTTATAFAAKALKDVGKNPSAVVGSIVPEFGSNFLDGSEDLFVIEGCEYKDHVLKLSPAVLVITNAEWDHTDWFSSLGAMQGMFKKAVEKLPESGAVVADLSNPNIAPIVAGAKCRVVDYSTESVPELLLPGEFNRMNARAAKAGIRALFSDINVSEVDASLASFKGTWRRFEYKGTLQSGALIYDDYAHHPTKQITLAFHPHLYTRTRDLFPGFVEELAKAERVILAPIYPAREEPVPGVTSETLANAINDAGGSARAFPDFDSIEKEIGQSAGANDVVMTIGAGDIYKVADRLTS